MAARVEEENSHDANQQRADNESEPRRCAAAIATFFHHMRFANLSHFGPPFFRIR